MTDSNLAVENRAAVDQLLAEYARLADLKDVKRWRALFTDDAVIVLGETELRGSALTDFVASGPVGTHVQGVPSVTLGDGGVVQSRSPFAFVHADGSGVIGGWYHDLLVPEGREYRFARRAMEVRTGA